MYRGDGMRMKRAAARHPPRPTPDAFAEANRLFKLGRLEEAARLYRALLAARPGRADIMHLLGLVELERGRHAEALRLIEAARATKPGDVQAFMTLGLVRRRLGQLDEALDCYDGAIKLRPANVDALHARANLLARLGRSEEAIAAYDKALAIKPGHAEAYNNKGNVLIELGRLEQGRAAIETAIALAPEKARFYYSLSLFKRFAPCDPHLAAMADLALRLPTLCVDDQIDLHFALGKAFADLGDFDRSFHHLARGNGLKFKAIAYDEAAHLALPERIGAAFPGPIAGLGDPSAAPVFIVGMPRSGSTLVEQILASHRHVFGAGEIDDFDRVLDGLGSNGTRPALDVLASLPREAWRRAGADYVERVGRTAPGATRITNKRLDNFRMVGLIHMALPNARIIHARRDKRDTCVSCFSKQFVDPLPYTYDLGALSRYYDAYERVMAHWRAVLPAGVMIEARYEEIIGDLEGQARRIVAHCGLDWDPRCLAFHETERPVRTASKSQVRQPMFDSSVGRWRDYAAHLGPLTTTPGDARDMAALDGPGYGGL
jgi:tetratricopeptide (TPR) repeat protein